MGDYGRLEDWAEDHVDFSGDRTIGQARNSMLAALTPADKGARAAVYSGALDEFFMKQLEKYIVPKWIEQRTMHELRLPKRRAKAVEAFMKQIVDVAIKPEIEVGIRTRLQEMLATEYSRRVSRMSWAGRALERLKRFFHI
jgi:hypothetical protein